MIFKSTQLAFLFLIFTICFLTSCQNSTNRSSPDKHVSKISLADKYQVSHLISTNQNSIMEPNGFPISQDKSITGDLENELRAKKIGEGEFKLFGTISPNFKGKEYSDPKQFVKSVFGEIPKIVVIHCVYGSSDDDFNNKLIRYLRRAGVHTKMLSNSRAFSGGVDLFTAGVKRIMHPNARLGVHSWGEPLFADTSGKELSEEEAKDICESRGIQSDSACLEKLVELGYKLTMKGGNQFLPLDKSNPKHKTYVELAENMGVSTDYYWLTLEVNFEGSLWLDYKVSKLLKLATD